MALIIVSILLTVNDIPKKIITPAISALWLPTISEKKARSGLVSGSSDLEISPVKPIKKTIGATTKNEINKLF